MAAEDEEVNTEDSSSRSSDRSSRYRFFTQGPSRWSNFARQRAVNWAPFGRTQQHLQPMEDRETEPLVTEPPSDRRLERSSISMPTAGRHHDETSSALSTIVSDTEISAVGDCRTPPVHPQTHSESRERNAARESNWSHRATIPVTWVVQTALCCLFSSMVCAFTSVVAVWALNRYFTSPDPMPELMDSCLCQDSKVDKCVTTEDLPPISKDKSRSEIRGRSLPSTKIPSAPKIISPPLPTTADIGVQAVSLLPRRPTPIDYLIVALQILAALPVVAVGAVIIYFIVMGLFLDIVQLLQRIFGSRPPPIADIPVNITEVHL